MYLLILIFTIFLIAQLILGVASWNLKKQLSHKYSHPLGEQLEVTDLLERYLKKHKNLKLKATGHIEEVILIEKGNLYVNKKSIHAKDLYSNIFLIFQMNLFKTNQKFLTKLFIFQNFVFLVEIILFIVGLLIQSEAWQQIILMIAIAVELILLISSIVGYLKYDDLFDRTITEAHEYLKLDNVEEARAEALLHDLRFRVWEYPFEIVWRVVQFLKP